jgi:hypothetical protein
VGFGRYLANPRVTVEELIESWSDLTRDAVAGRHVLAIQDTSEIHISTRPGHRRGLGKVGKGNVHGVLAHVMVAVDAGNGACLGLVTGSIYNRKGRRAEVAHAKRARKDRESKRWTETAQAAKPILAAAAAITVICDREGDIFEDWATVPGRNVHMLTRLRMDRGVEGGGTVSQAIDDWTFVAIRDVELPAASEREKRKAALSLRFGPIVIRRPHAKGVGRLPETIALRLVEVVERDPPAGVEPIHWRLLTTHAVDDETMAWQIVDWYRRRWTIEQLFRLMKSDGLQLEDSELESADGLMKLTAIAAKAACEVLQLVQARDGLPEPASLTFTPAQIAVLDHLNDEKQGATALQKNPHPRHGLTWASWIIARLGGWNGYPKSRPPGPITMRKGLAYFQIFAKGWTNRVVCIP